jgi:peptidoglycan/xylan/chitin deacetylase (PgdA/CDA1 family)
MQTINKRPTSLRILTYHRVSNLTDTPHLHSGLISATPERFAAQMKFLKNHYHVVSMAQVLEAAQDNQPLPFRAVLITFDDGYRDFATNAWPVLKSLGLPVTLFVPTAYPDQPQRRFWWDKLHVAFLSSRASNPPVSPHERGGLKGGSLKQIQSRVKMLPHDQAMLLVDELFEQSAQKPNGPPPVLGWDELRRLAKEGVTLGAHTQTHPILTRISLEDARKEIIGSQADLQREIGAVLPVFSYPDGGHNDAVVEILKKEGFLLGFNGPTGVNNLRLCDPFRLRRINITPKSTPFIFQLRLTRWFGEMEKIRMRKRIREVET